MLDQVEVTVLVARRLDAAGIPYMRTGSIALSYYAEPRFTRDIDVVVELPASATGQLASTFKDDFYVDEEAVVRAASRAGMTSLSHRPL